MTRDILRRLALALCWYLLALASAAGTAAAPPSDGVGSWLLAARNSSQGIDLVLARGQAQFSMNLPDLYLSPVCLGGRCSLLVMPAPANSTTRFPLLPAVNSVIAVKISLSSSDVAMTDHHSIPLLSQTGGCSPVFVTPDQSNMDRGYVVCVQDSAAVHLLRVNIDTSQLSKSAATGSLSHYQATSLSCLSNMVTSHSSPQHVNIFFSDCSQVVRLSLSTQVFTPLDGATTCDDVADIKTLPGHPSTLLLTCNTSALIYYDIDSEVVINQTMPTSPKQPSPCSDPLVRMTVVPAAGDVEYGTWAMVGCTHTVNVSDAALLSWQCLGDRDNLVFICTTLTGLSVARLNLIDECSLIPPPPQTMTLSPADCTNDRCLPLTTIDDQYLVFQFSGATPGLYTYIMYDITPTITVVASINHATSFLMVTALPYELTTSLVPPTPSYTTTTTATTTTITTTTTTTTASMGPSSSPSPTPANDGLLVVSVVVPIIAVIVFFIILAFIVIGIILYIKRRPHVDSPPNPPLRLPIQVTAEDPDMPQQERLAAPVEVDLDDVGVCVTGNK